MNRNEPINTCAQVGGQAVMEGVMMRSPNCLAIAVRRASGEIIVRESHWRSIWERLKFLRWPFLRGTVVMAEAMVNGIQALNFSASQAMEDEAIANGDAKPSQGADSTHGGIALGLTMAVSLMFAVLLFKFIPHMAAAYSGKLFAGHQWTVNDWSYHAVDGVVKIGIFLLYVAIIGRLKEIRRLFQYHGAEHMAIYTHEAGEELTVENARGKSTLHPRCGTSFIMVVLVLFMIVAALLMPFLPEWVKPGDGKPWFTHALVVLFKLPLLIPVAGLAYEFNRFAGRHTSSLLLKPLLMPGMATQLLTTKRPNDEQLEIALVALRTTLWREEMGLSDAKDGDEDDLLRFGDFADFVDRSTNLRPEPTGA